jgi:regulator of protease activity HflC (stomatin/prohibitin superfamily)
MKKLLGMALLIALGATSAGCTRIEPGEVGVKVNRYGSGSGVDKTAVGVGNYFSLWGVDYIPYPVSTQTFTWAKGDKDSDGNTTANQEFSFQDKNGLIVQGDVTIAFRVNPSLAPKLYQIYRMDMNALVAGPIRNKIRSEIVKAASTMTVEQIYSSGKTVLISRAMVGARAYFEPMGLSIDQLEWAGPIRIPESIMERINARAQSEQAAIAAQAEALTAEAKGKAYFAQAQAEANAKIERARGEAESIKIKNSAIEANPAIQDEFLRRWDGHLPQTVICSQDRPCGNLRDLTGK